MNHKGSSYIPLPKALANKKSIKSIIKNEDGRCFEWALLSKLSSYKKYRGRLNFKGIFQHHVLKYQSAKTKQPCN